MPPFATKTLYNRNSLKSHGHVHQMGVFTLYVPHSTSEASEDAHHMELLLFVLSVFSIHHQTKRRISAETGYRKEEIHWKHWDYWSTGCHFNLLLIPHYINGRFRGATTQSESNFKGTFSPDWLLLSLFCLLCLQLHSENINVFSIGGRSLLSSLSGHL